MTDETVSARQTVAFLLGMAGRLRQRADEAPEPSDALKQQVNDIADEIEAEARRMAEEYGIDLSGLLQSN